MKKLDQYRKAFSEFDFWNKLKRFATNAGVKVVYSALILYFAYRRSETPGWAKRLIVGVLGYLVTPIDLLPDLTIFLGYSDDLSMLSFALATVAAYINDDVRSKARKKLTTWFPDADEKALAEVEKQL